MMVDATCTKLTNTVKVTDKVAPINQLLHANELVDATFTDIALMTEVKWFTMQMVL